MAKTSSRKKSPRRSKTATPSERAVFIPAAPIERAEPVGTVLVNYVDLRAMGVRWTRVHLRRLCAAGKFPAPIKLSDHRVAWRLADIETWLSSRAPVSWAATAGEARDATR